MEAEKDLLFFKAKGTSMRPFFKTGDMFIVKKVYAKNIKIGDIIAYNTIQHKDTICHRLIKKACCGNNYVLYARGDMSVQSAEKVAEADLIGKAIAVIRNGRVANFTTPYQQFINFSIVIFLPLYLRSCNFIKRRFPFLRKLKRALLG